MELVECCNLGTRPEGQLVCQYLFAQDIRSVLNCDDGGGEFPNSGVASRVFVSEEDYEMAAKIIKSLNLEPTPHH